MFSTGCWVGPSTWIICHWVIKMSTTNRTALSLDSLPSAGNDGMSSWHFDMNHNSTMTSTEKYRSILSCAQIVQTEKKLTHCGLVTLFGSRNLGQHQLTQVMACCLTALSHYLHQCWVLISEVLWHSPKSNFRASARASVLYGEFENHTFNIFATTPRGQWANCYYDLKLNYELSPMLCSAKCSHDWINNFLTHWPLEISI